MTVKIICIGCGEEILLDADQLDTPMACSSCGTAININMYPKLVEIVKERKRRAQQIEKEHREAEKQRLQQEKEQWKRESEQRKQQIKQQQERQYHESERQSIDEAIASHRRDAIILKARSIPHYSILKSVARIQCLVGWVMVVISIVGLILSIITLSFMHEHELSVSLCIGSFGLLWAGIVTIALGELLAAIRDMAINSFLYIPRDDSLGGSQSLNRG
jgi:DNA-directed RNA polymerase subunit M/transcription elongation factor TFIIS